MLYLPERSRLTCCAGVYVLFGSRGRRNISSARSWVDKQLETSSGRHTASFNSTLLSSRGGGGGGGSTASSTTLLRSCCCGSTFTSVTLVGSSTRIRPGSWGHDGRSEYTNYSAQVGSSCTGADACSRFFGLIRSIMNRPMTSSNSSRRILRFVERLW